MNQHLKIHEVSQVLERGARLHRWICGICGAEGQDCPETYANAARGLSLFGRLQLHFGRPLYSAWFRCPTRHHGRCLTCRHWDGPLHLQLLDLAEYGDARLDAAPRQGVCSVTSTQRSANETCRHYGTREREAPGHNADGPWCRDCCMPRTLDPCRLCRVGQ